MILGLRGQGGMRNVRTMLGKNKKTRSKKDEELRKKRRVVKHAEKTSRSKENRVEREVRRKVKAESVSAESISDFQL